MYQFLILTIYLAKKPFRAIISIVWLYRYISLKNLSEWIYWFLDFIDISRSKTFLSKYIDFLILTINLAQKTFPSEYINFLILTIYLARKPFWANISIFWLLRYTSLKNLSERKYLYFDFIDISRLKTFPSEYIDFSILSIYLARKPFRA